MGLDATVRCRCFEEGKLTPDPVPVEDLYIDETGHLASREIDAASEKYSGLRFRMRYGKLQKEFRRWVEQCCEHEYGDYCSEQISNWTGCDEFKELVKAAGGADVFPLLSNLLPENNDGMHPSEKAAATLEELNRFLKVAREMHQWVLCDNEYNEMILRADGGVSSTFMYNFFGEVGLCEGKVFFELQGLPRVETSHFKQVPIGTVDDSDNQRMKILCLDTGVETETFDSVGPDEAPKTEREFHVVSEAAPFFSNGKYPLVERIRNLLVASIETGNPIRWC